MNLTLYTLQVWLGYFRVFYQNIFVCVRLSVPSWFEWATENNEMARQQDNRSRHTINVGQSILLGI